MKLNILPLSQRGTGVMIDKSNSTFADSQL